MRVCMLSQYFPRIGGIETHTYNLVRALTQKGVEVHLLKIHQKHQDMYLRMPSLFLYNIKNANAPLVAKEVAGIATSTRCDLLHVHCNLYLAIVGLLGKWLSKMPLICTLHLDLSDLDSGERSFLFRAFPYIKQAFYEADALTVVSEHIIKQIKQLGIARNDIIVTRNSVDLDLFDYNIDGSSVRRLLEIGQSPLILFVGRIVPEKGLDYLTLAMREVVDEMPNAKLLIIGDGPYKEELRDKVKKLKLSQEVIFAGKVDYESLPWYYAAADAIVLSSLSEASGYTLIEAQAMRKPVIGTKVGGIPEILSHGKGGLLVEPRNVSQLSSAIFEILRNPQLAQTISKYGYEYVKNQMQTKHTVDAVLGLYRSFS